MSLDLHPDLPLDTVPKQVDGFELERIPCCFILKHTETGRMVKLNNTGLLIWQTCTGEWTVGEIIEALQENYPDAAETMARDVFRALDILRDEAVIDLQAA
jgi:coenzyme PQQ biosynthesis protein PqqD